MYENFYGLAEKPFSLLPDPDFLYLGEQHSMALAMLQYGLMNQAGFTVITGEIGCGKTTLIRQLLNEMDQDTVVGLISNTHRAFGGLLEQILLAFRLEAQGMSKAGHYQRLVTFLVDNYAAGQHTVLIVDESQNLDVETLEELRLLSNVNADKDQILQLILVGQPELWDKLNRPDLVQFAQRISVDYFLEPLSREELTGYIQHRLLVAGGSPDVFSPEAITLIFQATGGVPRLANTLCDTAMVYGYARQSRCIDRALMEEVIRDKSRSGLFRCGIPGPQRGGAAPREAREAPDVGEPSSGPVGQGRRADMSPLSASEPRADSVTRPPQASQREETAPRGSKLRVHAPDGADVNRPQQTDAPPGEGAHGRRFRAGPGKV